MLLKLTTSFISKARNKYLAAFTCLIGASLATWLLQEKRPSCGPDNPETVYVRGMSMFPMFPTGAPLTHLPAYYECPYREIQRGDLVTFEVPGRNNFVLKQIKAVPGDRFEYRNFRPYVNGEALRNSAGHSYIIKSKMLELYAREYPIIPAGAYLVLGDDRKGSLDSARYGLIHQTQIIGKVVPENPSVASAGR